MSSSDIKKRADELAVISAKIKYLSKESKLDEIHQTIVESQKNGLAMSESVMHVSNFSSGLLVEPSERSVAFPTKKASRHVAPPDESTVKELIDLRQHNLTLEEELKKLRSELESTQQRLEKAEDKRDQALTDLQKTEEELAYRRAIDRKPYFQISDLLLVHVSRLPISEDRLAFLKYSQFKVSLKEDMVTLRSDQAKKEFVLDSIVKVLYYQDTMSLHVNSTGAIKDYYLIKFETAKQMKKWDRALYMNRKLSMCLDRQRLFQHEFPEDNKNSRYYRQSVISERTNEDEPSLNQRSIPELPKQNVGLMRIEQQDSPPPSKLDDSISMPPISHNIVPVMPEQSPSTIPPFNAASTSEVTQIRYAQSYTITTVNPVSTPIESVAKEPQQPTIIVKEPLQPAVSLDTETPLAPTASLISNTANQQSNMSSPNSSPKLLRKPTEERPRTSSMQRRQAIENLKKGFVMTKYAKRGLKPHKKFVYVSQETMSLIWEDIDTHKKNQIALKDIRGFSQKYGQGMSSKKKELEIEQCVVIESHDRVLELSSDSREKMDQFLTDLDCILRSLH